MRKRVVSRTIKSNKVTVMCVNKESAEVTNEVYIVPVEYKTEKKKIDFIASNLVKDKNVKIVTIVNEEITTALYTMPEHQFIELATVKE